MFALIIQGEVAAVPGLPWLPSVLCANITGVVQLDVCGEAPLLVNILDIKYTLSPFAVILGTE
jgi:hypothetical protein